ncbi:protein-disulfide reductase DsbD domain-containing protein [Primorskyibacter sp. S187A]|uniref:protein-disulfide reductase DsbD domain-containing protein n=1 Tax=Primorskyibacter sp. S187A TaxID=3415130 RepID=UPI003C7D5FD6
MTSRVLPCAALALSMALPAFAQVDNDMVHAEVLPGWRDADGTHMAALRITLAPGWKTFWRAPGDAGIPPRFRTEGSENLSTMRPIWPTPHVFNVSGMRTVGYQRELILPLEITPEADGDTVSLAGTIDMGICSDVCVPASLTFEATLPPDGASDARIVAAILDTPYSASEAGVAQVDCFMGPVQYGMGLRAEITLPQMAGREEVVVEASDPYIWVAEPRSWWEGDVLIAETELSHTERQGFTVTQDDLRITVIADGEAVDIQGCATE